MQRRPIEVRASLKKRDENYWEKGDHSGARFDLCTMYGHINQQSAGPSEDITVGMELWLTKTPTTLQKLFILQLKIFSFCAQPGWVEAFLGEWFAG